MLFILGIFVSLALLINVTPVQNFIVKQVSEKLSQKLHTEVKVRHVDFKLFNTFQLEGTYVEDLKGDTLLYAEELDVNINNFFFLRDQAKLYYLGMKDVTVNMERQKNDSTWNFQFIVDAFSNPNKSKKATPNISLKKIELKKVHFNQVDHWKGKEMHISAKDILIQTDKISLPKHIVHVNNIQLNQPLFVQVKDKSRADSISRLIENRTNKNEEDTSDLRWNTQHWDIQIGTINLNNGAFVIAKKHHHQLKKYFDPDYIAFHNIDGTLKNTRFEKDSVISLVDITALGRGGVKVRELHGRYKMSPITIEVSDLDLRLNQSHITDFFALQFNQFGDLGDFTTKVTMVGDFKNSYVTSGDIGFFAPTLKDWEQSVTLNGFVSGTLNKLSSDHFELQAGNSSSLEGNFTMSGLPDVYNTFIDFQIENLKTTGQDIQRFLPFLSNNTTINLDSLHTIQYQGSYFGFIFDFVSYGDFSTNLGNLHTDVNFKFGPQHIPPTYSGQISSTAFNIGALINNNAIGRAAFNTQIKGAGFSLATVNTSLDGDIDLLEFKGYPYNNIQVDGRLKQKFFQGQLNIADSNLALNFKGDIDFNKDTPTYNFVSDIQKAKLQTLNITKDSIAFKGKLNLNLRGNNIDNFLGEARLYDIDLYKDGNRIALDTLAINSSIKPNNEKRLTVTGNGFNGYLQGQYTLSKIPDAAIHLLDHYFHNKIKATGDKDLNSKFEFAFSFKNLDSVVHTFSPQIPHLNGGELRGYVNMIKDSFYLHFNLNQTGYKHYTFNDIRINAIGSPKNLKINNIIGEIYNDDSLILPRTSITTFSQQDTSTISLKTSGNIAINKADIKLKMAFLKNGFYAKFLQSAISLNNKKWQISANNEIRILQDSITIHDFELSHNNQQISLTSPQDPTSKNTFFVNLKNLNINDFSKIFIPDIHLEGVANGNFEVNHPLDTMKIKGKLTTTHFRINNDSIGKFTTSTFYNEQKSIFKWDIKKTNNPEKNFQIQGKVGLGENLQLQGNFDLNHTNIAFLNKYVDGYVSNLDGNVTGDLKLQGDRKHPQLIGDIKLHDAHFLVDYTQVRYSINNETIRFEPDEINLGSIVIKDSAGRVGVISGTVKHQSFNDIYFDVNMQTQGLELINTSITDNPVYYGHVVGAGRIDFSGPLTNMKMVINASPLEDTHLYLPLTDDKDIGNHDFIVFKKYGEALSEPKDKHNTNLSVKLFADINPKAQIDVIVDPTSGDYITAAGNGALQINVDLNGGFNIYGNYAITEGKYVFSFRGLLTREFAIDQGSSITWNGDPFNANINITAIYHVPGGANLYNLIAGDDAAMAGLTNEDKRLLRQRENIDVYLSLKNSLLHPDITYDIRIPDASISASSLAMTKLQEIRQNPNTLINQVAGLLAAGQFIPITSGTTSSNILRSSGLSSAGQWVSSQLTGVLNNLFGDELNDLGVSFSLDYNTYSAMGNQGGDIFRNDVQVNMSKSLFNNRIQLKVGPSINWGRTSTSNSTNNSYFAGDFRLEYLINPSGQLRFVAFSRSNYNILLNHNLTRAGIGLSYSHQFNKLSELFMTKEEKARRDSVKEANFEEYLKRNIKEEALPYNLPKIPPAPLVLPKKNPVLKEDE